MNWADQQPGESRAHWKQRTYYMHYGAGNRAHASFEQMFANGVPQPGDTFTINLSDGFADSFTQSAGPTYYGRPDDWAHGGRQWFTGEGETRAERLLNTIEDWDELGVELPELILVPTSGPDGSYTITRLEA